MGNEPVFCNNVHSSSVKSANSLTFTRRSFGVSLYKPEMAEDFVNSYTDFVQLRMSF